MANDQPTNKPKKPYSRRPFTPARRRQFILHLSRLGVVQYAAREADVPVSTVYRCARRNRDFAEQMAAALGRDPGLQPGITGNNARGATPKQVGGRHNGFTPRRRETFLGVLAATSNVRHAAAMAGMTHSAAYKLRQRDAGFRTAWQEAIDSGFEDLAMDLLARARFGTPKPIVHAGLQTGEVKIRNDRLGLQLLDRYDKHRARMEEHAARIGDAGSQAAIEKRITDLRRRLLENRPDLVKDDGYDAMIAAREASAGDGEKSEV